eukprot:scaffold1308_cov247-Pinguiococcus_pyrenoidosus.AAC.7
MAAVAAGTPGIVLPIDERVKELAEVMQIPHVAVDEVDGPDAILLQVVQKAADAFDAANFEDNRRCIYSTYRDILHELDLEIHPELEALLIPTIRSAGIWVIPDLPERSGDGVPARVLLRTCVHAKPRPGVPVEQGWNHLQNPLLQLSNALIIDLANDPEGVLLICCHDGILLHPARAFFG